MTASNGIQIFDKYNSSSLIVKDVNIEDFEVMNFLGSGGFGKVFQVTKLHGEHKGRIFAMKIEKKTEMNKHDAKESDYEVMALNFDKTW